VRCTILKACQAAQQAASAAGAGLILGYRPAVCLECKQLPLAFQRRDVYRGIDRPEVPDRIHPPSRHCFDVGPFLGHMAVFGGVVVAYDKMRDIGREVVLVYATQLGDFVGYVGLENADAQGQSPQHSTGTARRMVERGEGRV